MLDVSRRDAETWSSIRPPISTLLQVAAGMEEQGTSRQTLLYQENGPEVAAEAVAAEAAAGGGEARTICHWQY